jgi:hypothetical protein
VGRRRTKNKHMPKGVFPVVNRHGQEYWYYQPGRGTKNAGLRVGLGKDTRTPTALTGCALSSPAG